MCSGRVGPVNLMRYAAGTNHRFCDIWNSRRQANCNETGQCWNLLSLKCLRGPGDPIHVIRTYPKPSVMTYWQLMGSAIHLNATITMKLFGTLVNELERFDKDRVWSTLPCRTWNLCLNINMVDLSRRFLDNIDLGRMFGHTLRLGNT